MSRVPSLLSLRVLRGATLVLCLGPGAACLAAESFRHETALGRMVCEEGLKRLEEHNPDGLGAEAARLRASLMGGCPLSLMKAAAGWTLRGNGRSRDISSGLGLALANMNGYFSLEDASWESPMTASAAREAFLSPAGVAAVRRVYEGMIAARLDLPDRVVILESGGEATLSPDLVLHEMPDPRLVLMREAARTGADPKALSRLYADNGPGMARIDEQDLLKNLLARLKEWEARGSPAKTERERLLRRTLAAVLESAAGNYLHSPESQLRAIIRDYWRGRHLGMWHAHPPHMGAEGFEPSGLPSAEDDAVASAEGQNLTLAFQPDGFDVFDLSRAAGPPGGPRKPSARHRSESWRRRFSEFYRGIPKKSPKKP